MVMESVEKKFVEEPILKYKVMKFLEENLDKAWIANVDIQKSPVATRINLEVLDPSKVIGKKGKRINELSDVLRKEFNLENPQINVVEVKSQWLEPRIVAKRAAKGIEMGKKVRAVLHRLLKNVMESGAIGAEIVAKGKLGAKGAKARGLKVRAGFVPKAGEPSKAVKKAHYNAMTKSGIIGINVMIAPPDIYLPDKKIQKKEKEEKEEQAKEEIKEIKEERKDENEGTERAGREQASESS
ncbi:MAG: 30S ribosomal protein S3 [Candidatus Anstonellales archaeon]